MRPKPVTTPSPGMRCASSPNSVLRWVTKGSSSWNEPWSSRTRMRSWAVSLFFACCASIRAWPPPSSAARRSSRSRSMRACVRVGASAKTALLTIWVAGAVRARRTDGAQLRTPTPSDRFDRHRDRTAAAEAKRGDPPSAAARPERVHQGCEHTRAARADRVAEGDRAAVHVELRPVPTKLPVVGDHLSGERLVQLDQIEVVEPGAKPAEQLANRHGRRAEQHARLTGRLRVAEYAGERPFAQLVCLFGARHDDRRRAITQAGGVAGRDGAVLLEGGAEPGERLGARVGSRRLVLGDGGRALRPGHLDRHDLLAEGARANRGERLPLALERERVLFLTRDPVALGDPLRAHPHV